MKKPVIAQRLDNMARKKALTNQHTTDVKNLSKEGRREPDPNCLFDFKQIPISEARINRVIEALDVWLKNNPEAKEIQEFYYEQGLSSSTYYKLLDRSTCLRELHDRTMHQLGGRMWGKAVDYKANWAPVRFLMQAYGGQYKEAKEYEEMLAKKYETSNGPQIVVIEKFASSDIVPERKKGENI